MEVQPEFTPLIDAQEEGSAHWHRTSNIITDIRIPSTRPYRLLKKFLRWPNTQQQHSSTPNSSSIRCQDQLPSRLESFKTRQDRTANNVRYLTSRFLIEKCFGSGSVSSTRWLHKCYSLWYDYAMSLTGTRSQHHSFVGFEVSATRLSFHLKWRRNVPTVMSSHYENPRTVFTWTCWPWTFEHPSLLLVE